MAATSALNSTVNKIVKEVKKFTPLEQEEILVKAKLTNYLNAHKKPIANYDSKKLKPPTMAQIDKWKHDSRVKK